MADEDRPATGGDGTSAPGPRDPDDLAARVARLSPKQLALLAEKLAASRRDRAVGDAGAHLAGSAAIVPTVSDGAAALTLSFGQERLWFLSQLEVESAAYNMPGAVRLRGRLDVRVLVESIREVVRRHEVLRATYHTVDGAPRQSVRGDVLPEIPLVDVAATDPSLRETLLQTCAVREARRPFDLAVGPVVRAQLLRLGDADHALLFTMHHIASDGWSIRVLVTELAALYDAFSTGRPSPLSQLPIQYADFAHWQRNWLSGDVLDRQLAYWRQQLAGAPAALELPTDRPRPAVQTSRGAVARFSLSHQLSGAIQALGRREGATLFMTLLGAWQVFLSRWSGQQDIVVGSPIANRTRVETEPLIGFFVNTLALRARLAPDATFQQVLREVRRTTIEAHAHQDVPFERLVGALDAPRDLSRTPLFQVMFVLQNDSPTLELTGLHLSALEVDDTTTKFDLTLTMLDRDGALHGSFAYNPDLFDADTVARMAEVWETLLQSVVATPHERIGSLRIVPQTQQQLLRAWNHTDTNVVEATVWHLYQRQMERTPDAIAVVFREAQLSFAEVGRRVDGLVSQLIARGIRTEDRVAVMLDRCAELVIAMLAASKLGAVYVPLDPAYPAERLRFMLEDSGARVVITDAAHATELQQDGAEVCLTSEWDAGSRQPRSSAAHTLADGLSYLLYTSGSTGRPKGVEVRQCALVNLLSAICAQLALSEADVITTVASPSFDVSLGETLAPLLAGARVVLVPRSDTADPERMRGVIAEVAPTIMQAAPSLWRMLIESGWSGSRGLAAISTGEALPRHLAERLRERSRVLWNLYGPTETTIWSSAEQVGDGEVLIGRPIANTTMHATDSRLEATPVGVIGELYIGGVGLARGYHARADLTADRFVPDPYGRSGERLYRTGDLARHRPDGRLECLGRVDHQVKLRGFRIELGEIEAALRDVPGARDAVVISREASGDQRLIAYVVGDDLSPGELRRSLSRRLPEFMIPAAFVVLDDLPRNANGKIDRSALPRAEGEGIAVRAEYEPPRTDVERALAELWAGALDLRRVGAHDDFFALGGHSLLATKIVSRLRQSFGIELPIRALFEAPTVAGLSKRIEEALSDRSGVAAPPVVRADRTGELPLSFGQDRLWFLDQLEPNGSAYNMPGAARLSGRVEVRHLVESFREVIRRHEILRTTYRASDVGPRQVVHERFAFDVPLVDLSAVEPSIRQRVVRECAVREARRPFELGTGAVVRGQLLRVDDEEHVLSFTMHHIASDGWSMDVLVREVATIYEAFSSGRPSPLPELAIQYVDYAQWLRSWLTGAVLEEQLRYWRTQLAGAPPALELPTDHPRPRIKSHRGGVVAFQLGAEVAAGMEAVARQQGATFFMVALAAWQLLLARYSGGRDIVVGTPIANRTRTETEGLIGFFVNTLALRTRIGARWSFRELLAAVKDTCLAAYAHQHTPFERVVDEIAAERDLARTPVFQVTLVVDATPRRELSLPGATLTVLDLDGGMSKFDLTLSMARQPDGSVSAAMVYDAALFERATVLRMTRHLTRLLEAAIARAETPWSLLPMMTDGEAAELARWNDLHAEYPADARLEELFQAQVEQTPAVVAVAYGDHQLTYAELDRRATAFAEHLRPLVIADEPRIGLLARRSVETMVGWLGILKAGAAYVPLDEGQSIERLTLLTTNAALSAVVLGGEVDGALVSQLPVPVMRVDDADPYTSSATVPPLRERAVAAPRSHAAYVIYTSGSTGLPKGVSVPHRAVIHLRAALAEAIGAYASGRPLRVSQNGPLSFDTSVKQLIQLLAGHTVVGIPEEVRYEGAALFAYARMHAIDVLDCTPVQLQWLTESNGCIGTLPRCLLVAGEAIPQDTWRRLGADGRLDAYNLYGPTECTVDSTVALIAGEAPHIGRPLANVRTHVLDTERQQVPVGVLGELWIEGDGIATGYLGSPERTADTFAPCAVPGGPAGKRCYATGDLARLGSDGAIEFRGRTDHQLKLRGHRIELGEIEQTLAAHPGVASAVATAHQVAAGDTRLVAYWTAAHGARPLEAQQLREHASRMLPDYMVPAAFMRLKRLPLTATGKVDRAALPEPEFVAAAAFVEPRDGVETMLSGIWAEVLGVQRVGVYDDFFELGGHSLLATQVVARVRRALAVELPLRAAFEAKTVSELADRLRPLIGTVGVDAAPALVPVDRHGDLPLSFGQQRLWFLDQLEPGSSAYNVPAAVQLRGPLEVVHIATAIAEVVRRHEVLRTTYQAPAGAPRQVIHDGFVLELPIVDLSGIDPSMRETAIFHCAFREARAPFDLLRGPVVRAQLLRMEMHDHVLTLTMHHIATDGWGRGVLVREVGTLYDAYVAGRPSPLARLPLQYADYACWQRRWLRDELLDRQLAYWRSQLRGAPEALELPTDRPRSRVMDNRGGAVTFQVDVASVARLRELAQQEGATLFMVLLAAWQLLLARYCGQRDIVVGTPVANRTRAETEGLIGFFVNMLALRTEVGDECTVREFVARVKETCLGAYAHQDVPFERIVDDLSPERDLGRTPVFQVMLVLQNAPQERLAAAGLELRVLEAGNATSKVDLTLALSEDAGGALAGTFEYAAELFDASTIQKMAEHLRVVLDSLVADPAGRLGDVDILTARDKKRLVVDLNDTASDYPTGACLHQLFEAQVDRTPDAIAVASAEHQVTYRELDHRANQVARHLRLLGVRPETFVGVCLDRTIELVSTLLGVLKAGAAYAPLDPTYPRQRLQFVLDDANAPVVVTQRRYAALLDAPHREMLCIDRDAAAIGAESQERSPPERRFTDRSLAYVIHTSGSTGRPKGVAIEHASAAMLSHWARDVFADDLDAVLASTSVCFDLSVFELFVPLSWGGTVVLVGDALQLPSNESARRARLVNTVPSAMARLVEVGGWPTTVRTVNLAGEPLKNHLVDKVYAAGVENVFDLYGPSEYTTYSTFVRRDPRQPPTVGRPIANTQAYLVDARRHLVPHGAVGELCLGGGGLSRGYLQRPELTAERFLPDPFGAAPGGRLYRTGDLLRYRGSNLEFVGRADHQVKVRGFRIELGEVDAALLAHGAVADAVVVVREDVPDDKRLVAYVVGSEGSPRPTAPELRQHLEARLPGYMVPSAFMVLPALPLTPNGKIDRRALPSPETTRSVGFVAPRDGVEELLAGIWSDVLRVASVGVHDDFFDLGGHSLLATQVVARIRRALDVELPLRMAFEATTVAALAERLRGAMATGAAVQAPRIQAVPRTGDLPLSFGQERLWFLDQLDPSSPAYNMPAAIRLQGPLQCRHLVASLQEVVRRHEVLRTTYRSSAGAARQVIDEGFVLEVPVVDLGGLDADARVTVARDCAVREAIRPFDLGSGPVLRGRIVRLGADEHLLLFAVHHIASDGWSIGVLVREVAALYAAFSAGQPSPLPDLDVQYADYAIWQRSWLSGPVLEQQIGYWKEQLAGAPAALELPTDRPRPAVQTFRGASQRFALSAELTGALHALARRESVTPFMELLCAWQVLLSRWSGQTDVVVGSPIANRTRADIEGLVGFFVNTLALRTHVRPNARFRELLAEVRTTALGAYAHQDVPFERLASELDVPRDLGRTPIFQVMFVYQNTAEATVETSGLRWSALEVESTTTKLDLTLTMFERQGVLHGTLTYNPDLFDDGTIQRMAEAWQTLLEAVVADADERVGSMRILPAAQHELLRGWNETEASVVDATPWGLVQRQIEQRPDAVAVVFEDTQLSFAEVGRRVDALVSLLVAHGVGPEDRVAVMLDRCAELVIAILAVLEVGAAYVPLDPAYPWERREFMLEDSGARLVITDPAHSRALEHRGQIEVCLTSTWPAAADGLVPACVRRPLGDGVAYVLYTSGSTGRPKGVEVRQRALVNLLSAMCTQLELSDTDVVPTVASPSFDVSLGETLAPLVAGARVVLVPRPATADPERMSGIISQVGATVMQAAPSMWRMLLESGWPGVADLRAISTGEALPRHLAERLRQRSRVLWNLYGPTETTIWSSAERVGDGEVLIGRPIDNTTMYAVDHELQPVPVGVVGELYIGGAGVARGYRGRPELTAERFVPDPRASAGGERLYRSGDLVRHRGDGRIECLGRVDHQVKLRGFRIELGEIEAALRDAHGVRDAVVVAREVSGEKRIVAYVVGDEISASTLREALSRRLPEFMIPAAFAVLDDLPRNANGKVDRKALPQAEAEDLATRAEYQPPRNATEQTLVTVWMEVLRLSRVGIHDNFFELGGDSILSVQVVARANAAGLRIRPRHLFEHPTIAELAAAVPADARAGEGASAIGVVPLTPSQRSFFELDPSGRARGGRWIVCEARLRLDAPLLRAALHDLVSHHDVLRARYRQDHGIWVQEIAAAAPEATGIAVDRVDLQPLRTDARDQAIEDWAHTAVAALDLERGPSLRAALFDSGDATPQRVAVLTHELLVDEESLRILVEDLGKSCALLATGQPATLPPKTASYKDWGARLVALADSKDLDAELPFWRSTLDAPAASLPADVEPHASAAASTALLSVRLDVDSTRALLEELPPATQADTSEVLLAALVRTLAAWTHQAEFRIEVATDVRHSMTDHVDVSRTVGCFRAVYPIRLELVRDESPEETLRCVVDTRQRVPRGGIGYGVARYLRRDALPRRPGDAPVAFEYLGEIDRAPDAAAPLLRRCAVADGVPAHPSISAASLSVRCSVWGRQLHVHWSYDERAHRRTTVEMVAARFLDEIRAMIELTTDAFGDVLAQVKIDGDV